MDEFESAMCLYREKRYGEAVAALDSPALQAHDEARFLLAVLLFEGLGTQKDNRRATQLLRPQAEAGKPGACYWLGRCLLELDESEEAQKWLRKAAEARHPSASYWIGRLFVDRNTEDAIDFLAQAAIVGKLEAQFELGQLLFTRIDHKVSEGVRWSTLAAEQGYMPAIAWQRQEAIAKYKRLADEGELEANYQLGKAYAAGSGVPMDHRKAVELFEQAAKAGHMLAQCYVGAMYANGLGARKDAENVAYWIGAAMTHIRPPEPERGG